MRLWSFLVFMIVVPGIICCVICVSGRSICSSRGNYYEEGELVPVVIDFDWHRASCVILRVVWFMKTMFSISYDLLNELPPGEQWDLIQSYQRFYRVHFDGDHHMVVMCR